VGNIDLSAPVTALCSGTTSLTLLGFKTIMGSFENICVGVPPGRVFHTFAARVGSAEPYGIDEAHYLSGACERFYTRRLSC
jgi:hypothetical protein